MGVQDAARVPVLRSPREGDDPREHARVGGPGEHPPRATCVYVAPRTPHPNQ